MSKPKEVGLFDEIDEEFATAIRAYVNPKEGFDGSIITSNEALKMARVIIRARCIDQLGFVIDGKRLFEALKIVRDTKVKKGQ